ncbi:MmgE/PrpD family protein [Nocardia aurantia]|uniref:MmgE/PrpD family protein n=1 Tax=Nocardia aurantia TaxID=2585199 RepID=UPI001886426F|nr:MmgE/PrpD family protein [Nocardia aurantia]
MEQDVAVTAALAEWAAALRFPDIPAATAAFARSQLISTLAAVRAGWSHPLGRRLVAALGRPLEVDAKQSAAVLAGLANCLDFDDVSCVGHLSVSTVDVPIAYAADLDLSGADLLTAVVAGNECAARLTSATILGPFFRAQTAAHCHQMGAAAALLRAREAGAAEWVSALGLALGLHSTPVSGAVLDSDLKMLTATMPVRQALDACDAARAGITGTADVLGGDDGLLARLSGVRIPGGMLSGLGTRWHTDTLTFKRFPGSAYSQAAYDCAQRMYRQHGPIEAAAVRRIAVHASLLTWLLDHKVSGHVRGPLTPVTAATFCTGYGIATLLREGALGATDFTPAALADPARWDLAARVEIVHDMALSERMVRATSPLGQALRQAGPAAAAWPELMAWAGDDIAGRLAELGPPEDTFEHATMAIGARVELEFSDGTSVSEDCPVAIGMNGPDTRRDHPAIVRRKFLGAGGRPGVLADLERIDTLGPAETARVLRAALADL